MLFGFGIQLLLTTDTAAPPSLALFGSPQNMVVEAPNGSKVRLVSGEGPEIEPKCTPCVELSMYSDASSWVTGRAGMLYRDLVPSRYGGSFIASHIRIPTGGPVPDYVHYHKVHFQAIYCYKGWVKVVYEDNGDPFILHPGDCVVQPPEIRHRVLECSDGLEVVEIGCPAIHATYAEHEISLPTPMVNAGRTWSGQSFVRHQATKATWKNSLYDGFQVRDTGIGVATAGKGSVRVLRGSDAGATMKHNLDQEFLLYFVLSGKAAVVVDGTEAELSPGCSITSPRKADFRLTVSEALEVLEISLPALQA